MRHVLLIGLVALLVGRQESVGQISVVCRALAQVQEGYPLTIPGKCGTPLVFDAYRHRNDFPAGVREQVMGALQRPTNLQKSRLSPSGHFRVHYDTTGTNTPQMIAGSPASPVPSSYEEFVDSACAIFDHCWDVEVNLLGFDAPPPDYGDGFGPEYDVYIINLGTNVFGYTEWLGEAQYESGARDRFASYITIDNDFLGFRTPGLNGLRVTAAHEFHHAIQVGSYGIWNTVPESDFYFYELTAVWMEDVVYNDVNDYYFDLPSFFRAFKDALTRSLSFVTYSSAFAGYERSVWDHFLEERFGRDIVRQIWNEMKFEPALRSMDRVLRNHGSSLASAFAEFAGWNLYTGTHADTVKYYKEGSYYPLIAPNAAGTFSGSLSKVTGFAYPLSIQYYAFGVSSDSVVAAISNIDFEGAYASPGMVYPLEVSLSSGESRGITQKVENGLTFGFVAGVEDKWRTLYWGTGGERNVREHSRPFPNPFRLHNAPFLTLPVDGSSLGTARVFILSSSFNLAFSGEFQIVDSFGRNVVYLPSSEVARDVGTGMYFIVVKTNENEYRWKVAILQ